MAISGDTHLAVDTMIQISDGDTLQLYACPVSPSHPHTARVQ